SAWNTVRRPRPGALGVAARHRHDGGARPSCGALVPVPQTAVAGVAINPRAAGVTRVLQLASRQRQTRGAIPRVTLDSGHPKSGPDPTPSGVAHQTCWGLLVPRLACGARQRVTLR